MKRTFKMLTAGVAAAAVMAAPMAASAQDDDSILAIAGDAGDFETLGLAVGLAGLGDLLGDCEAGPFTVLAPTDEAFGTLPEETTNAAIADPSGLLTDVLLYHVVEGAALAETVVELDSAETVQGEEIAIEVVDGGVVLNGSINVVTTDIEACNGVIHVIDGVLLPPSITGDDGAEEEAAEEEAPLPATGVNSLTAGLAAAALLAGGVALVGMSRRRITV